MKKIQFVLKMASILLLAALLIASCNKEGPQGIPGPPGNGGVGPVGPAGKDGSMFLTGTGAPDSTTGNTGDYYLDKKAGTLYGPKTSSGWGSPFTFSGSEGGKIYGGNGTPDSTFGNAGDFYLDTTNYLLYGPKLSDSSWGPGLMLKGSGGSTGVTAYIISNPYYYLTNNYNFSSNTDDGDFGFYLKLLYDEKDNFDLWKSTDSSNNMIAVYFKRSDPIIDQNTFDIIGYEEEFVSANDNIPFYDADFAPDQYSFLQSNYYIYQNRLNIQFSGGICGECGVEQAQSDFKADTRFESIEIFVISPSALHNIALPPPGRIDSPDTNLQIRKLIQPYLQ